MATPIPTETVAQDTSAIDPKSNPLFFKVLGRTLEHFGVQMYKRREVAVAELVANCWDAGAGTVLIQIPEPDSYNPATSQIVIRDDGFGMTRDDVQQAYLVLGRNRRRSDGEEVELPLQFKKSSAEEAEPEKQTQPNRRRVMGRKGIGKLAGFGLARRMTVKTWKDGGGLQFFLDLDRLKLEDNSSEAVPIQWHWITPSVSDGSSGTVITLEVLKHKTAIDIDKLRLSIARRFSRTVRGEMSIKINDVDLPDPTPPLDYRDPDPTAAPSREEKLSDGNIVRYWYGFASEIIHERELRGFTILVHGKVAQAPPFFFDVEAKASGQHSTKYVIGEIEADFVDSGTDDEGDLVSTDRQEIDWEDERVKVLLEWGEKLSRKALAECADFRGKKTKKQVLADANLKARIDRLDPASQKEIDRFLTILGGRDQEEGRTIELADALIRAYEFRQFHDVIGEIEKAAIDPNKLAVILRQLSDWKVLESRAILEIIKGRLGILDKFEKMLCNDAPETASSRSPENMHDLLAGNPWLLNPEWQVLSEEKKITTQLREWGEKDLPDFKGRYDFLALGSEGILVLIEIKRSDYPAELNEMSRLIEYQDKLSLGHKRPIQMVFICGRDPKVSKETLEGFENNPHFEIRHWSSLFDRTRKIYEHYRAVLEGSVNDPGFKVKEDEVLRTRSLLEHGVHRDPEERAKGIPAQDVKYDSGDSSKT
jgi:hypothetical protein